MYSLQQIENARYIQQDALDIAKILASENQVPLYIGFLEFPSWVSVYYINTDDFSGSLETFYYPCEYLMMTSDEIKEHWLSCVPEDGREVGLLL